MTAGPSMTRSLLTSFLNLYEQDPGRILFTFVDDKGVDRQRLTVADLASQADAVACALPRWGLVPGDRALLVYPPSLDFVGAFLGCLAAGVLPVPVCPPDPLRLRHDVAAFTQIATDCGAGTVLTNSAYELARTAGNFTSLLARHRMRWPDLTWRRTDRARPSRPLRLDWRVPGDPAQPAFLQYTSGSTSAPRGVVVTHGNMQAEVEANTEALGLGPDTRGVCWVPHFHDLGLISFVLSTVVGNSSTYLMSPMSFLRRPALWMETMDRVRATHTAAPNFAYDLVVRKSTREQRARWDLRSLRVVCSGGEPVRPETVRRFLDACAPAGLAEGAFYPAYGLAECTLSVTMGGRAVLHVDRAALAEGRVVPLAGSDSAGTAEGITLVGSGRVTKADSRVRIVDPQTHRPCPEDQVGEIWVDSPTKAAGYYGFGEENRELFQAKVTDDDDPRRYLRTGDLGFFHQAELFVTGRLKDLIIVHGRNVYPQDVEASAAQAHPLIRPGGVAAFVLEPVPGGDTERVVVFVETRQTRLGPEQRQELIQAVRHHVRMDHSLVCHAVVLGGPGTVTKTTSGKVRRGACRQAFLSGAVHRASTTLAVDEQPAASGQESSP
ncbi:fatty acyl-AMP ligase [Amycolatopsis sp. QT-25]|uniref:fatty acyl-AMP ligase n=1 Tax=Amycolatopsis sp. QT-25 TaxID=3034022 RepID=UPI0023EC811D|nr:fatty acyl-AMP ligase [Amycolatopsis sp. QT-25]WET82549.1 fatty acyl-AMP ligase [Amycolatopsis sp. QT-25]